jgi:predicted RNA binding protein YcfA (HicA-like mRNA interferase family)
VELTTTPLKEKLKRSERIDIRLNSANQLDAMLIAKIDTLPHVSLSFLVKALLLNYFVKNEGGIGMTDSPVGLQQGNLQNSGHALTVALFLMLCIIHIMNSRELIKQLEADGWILRGAKGSHHIFVHPSKPGHISVPHPKKDMGIGIVHALLKQAGLKGE